MEVPLARLVGEGHLGGVFSRIERDLFFIVATAAIVSLLMGCHAVVRLLFRIDFGS